MNTNPLHRLSRGLLAWLAILCLCSMPGLTLAAQTPRAGPPEEPPEAGFLLPVPMARGDAGGTNTHPGPPPYGGLAVYGFALIGERVDVQPVIADDMMFVVTHLTHRLVAINVATSEERWSVDGAAEMEPVIVDDIVIYETGNPADRASSPGPAALTALDRDTGSQVRWTMPLPSHTVGRLVVTGDVVLVPTEGEVIALDPRSGQVRWRFSGLAVSGIAAEGETVVLDSTGDREVVALDMATGDIRWSLRPNSLLVKTIVIDGMIYATSERDLVALDLASGNEAWRITLPAPTDELDMLAASGTTVLAADSEGLLFAVDATSRQVIWTYEHRNGFEYSDRAPVVAGNLVFIQGEDSPYEAIDLETGKPRYMFPQPVLDDDNVPESRNLTVSGFRAFLSTTEGVIVYSPGGNPPLGFDNPVPGSTFTSESFGYSLAWNDQWEAEIEESSPEGDAVGLLTTESVFAVTLVYTTERGSLRDDDCAGQIGEHPRFLSNDEPGSENIRPAPAKVPTSGLPEGSDAAAFHIAWNADEPIDPTTALIVCVPVESSQMWVAFEMYAIDYDYEVAVSMFLDLLAGFDPDGRSATPPSTTRPRATRYS